MQMGGTGQDERDLFASFGRSRHRLLLLLKSISQIFEYARWELYSPKSGAARKRMCSSAVSVTGPPEAWRPE